GDPDELAAAGRGVPAGGGLGGDGGPGQVGVPGHGEHCGPDEHLGGDLGGHRVAGPREERRPVPEGPHPELATGPHGDAGESYGGERCQDLLDGVVRAVAQTAGGDDQVGAHELVLQGVAQRAALVGDGGHPVGGGAGVVYRGGERVAVGVVHLAGLGVLARLDELVPHG